MKPGFSPAGKTWYLENSREQIRDETIRQGFITNNAAFERPGVPTTSSKPRYALRADFAPPSPNTCSCSMTAIKQRSRAWPNGYKDMVLENGRA